MVKKIISERHLVTMRYHVIEFDHVDGDGGYSFPADENGNVKFDPKYEVAHRKSYELAMKNHDYCGPFHRIKKHTYTENAKAICECGVEIELWDQYHGACKCKYCGRWHNLFGQTLVNPKFWENDEQYGENDEALNG